MRRFSHYGYEPGGTIDWSQELAPTVVPTGSPVVDTETGVPYYLARPTDPGTAAGYQQSYPQTYYPGGVGSQESAGGGVLDFFKNLLGGVSAGMQPRPQQQLYYRPPQQSGMSWVAPVLGVAAAVGVGYFLLRK